MFRVAISLLVVANAHDFLGRIFSMLIVDGIYAEATLVVTDGEPSYSWMSNAMKKQLDDKGINALLCRGQQPEDGELIKEILGQ